MMILKEEPNWFHREDFYMAQIAAEIRRVRGGFKKNPPRIKNTDCLIKFEPKKPPVDLPYEQRLLNDKEIILRAFGLSHLVHEEKRQLQEKMEEQECQE